MSTDATDTPDGYGPDVQLNEYSDPVTEDTVTVYLKPADGRGKPVRLVDVDDWHRTDEGWLRVSRGAITRYRSDGPVEAGDDRHTVWIPPQRVLKVERTERVAARDE
jgi:hypothetical protein